MIKEFHESKNLFDKNQSSTIGFVREDGTINDNNNYRISDYIQLLPNTQYTVSNMNVNGLYPSVCFYTDNKTYISGIKYDGATVLTFTTPSNCKYVLVSYLFTLVNDVMLNTGSTALPYEPYFTPVWKSVSYAKSITGAQTFTKFPIVLRTTQQSIPTDFSDSLIGYLGKESNYNLYPWSHVKSEEGADINQDITIERDGWYSIDYTFSGGIDGTIHSFTFRDFDSQGDVHTIMRAVYDEGGTFRQTFLIPLKAGTYRYSHGGIGTLDVYMNRRDFA